MSEKSRLLGLANSLSELSDYQISMIAKLVEQFNTEFIEIESNVNSDVFDTCLLRNFGDVLRLHHCFSREPFTKDKFEHALFKTLNFCGQSSSLASRGNPGYDLILNEQLFSLKTQADKNINNSKIHISKFMELGKGEWTNKPEQLDGLLKQFLNHILNYDRILTLRCLSKYPKNWKYELVEIPKILLLEAQNGELEMKLGSTQTPKPGYCRVLGKNGVKKFELYFDGGGERKLQIKGLAKELCVVHAYWEFTEIESV